MEKSEKRTMPLWLGVFCLILTVSSLTFSVFAYATQYQVVLPLIGELQFVSPELQIESFSFTYNSTLMQYTEAIVDIRNTGSMSHTAEIDIKLYTTGNVQIAFGSASTGVISGGTVFGVPPIALTWQIGYTVANLTRGEIQIQQTS